MSSLALAHAPARRLPAWALGLLAYVAAWTVLPALLAPSMPFDGVEGIAWGHEWQWGYYKHPPLPAWLLYPAYVGLGKFGPYLVGQLSIVLALVYVYRLARELLGPERAGLAAALLYGVAYYTWPTLSFNHNIAQIPVWAALAWHAHAAMQRKRTRDWVWLGVWAGLGLLTKYSSAVMLACLAAYLVLGPQRRLLRQRGPWLALGVAALMVAPHLLWLWQHDGMPFTYLAERSQRQHGPWAQRTGLRFLAAQALMHLPLAVLLLACGAAPRGRRLYLRDPTQARWLLTIALAPALLVVVMAFSNRALLRDMWGTPMWNFSPMLLLALAPPEVLARRRRALHIGLVLWMVGVTVGMAMQLGGRTPWRNGPTRTDWPAQALGHAALAQWQDMSSCPLQVVAGRYWPAGLVAEQSRPMASVLIAGDARHSPWISAERLREQGALLVWRSEDAHARDRTGPPPVPLLESMPAEAFRVSEGEWAVDWPRNTDGAPLRMHWRAYVPAACAR